MHLRWQLGNDTDIGGGRENQDDCFSFSRPQDGVVVIGVLDGHGREVGKIAANAAKAALVDYFHGHFLELKHDPYQCLVLAHEVAHAAVKTAFRTELESLGFEVMETDEGYLTKKKGAQQWSCVHGGSSCSLCALVDGVLYVANVGDSSGTLCSTVPLLSRIDMQQLGDAALAPGARARDAPTVDTPGMERSTTMVLTAEHSPECPYEFVRMRDFRPRDGDPRLPALNVVYDTPSHEKVSCPQVRGLLRCRFFLRVGRVSCCLI